MEKKNCEISQLSGFRCGVLNILENYFLSYCLAYSIAKVRTINDENTTISTKYTDLMEIVASHCITSLSNFE